MSDPVVINRVLPRQPSLSLTTRSRRSSGAPLQYAQAVRKLFPAALNCELPSSEMTVKGSAHGKKDQDPAEAESSAQAIRKEDRALKMKIIKRNDLESQPISEPYLRVALDSIGVDVMADSANMETLVGHKDYLRATFVTPESMQSRIEHVENFYHVWVAVTMALEAKRGQRRGIEEVVKDATSIFMVELGSALIDCLKPGLPHYTFLDSRRLSSAEGRSEMIEQAVSIVRGFERKGITRDRIFVTIPATECGLELALCLKDQHSIKTNLAFVSGPVQASACVAAGADAITMSVGPNLQYHETRRGAFCHMLKPHPGFENIKAVACYLKHNGLKTKLNVMSMRSIDEVQQLSAANSVCFADWQLENVRWYRSRIARPPGSKSTATLRATQMPFPPLYTKDNLKYFATMSYETKRETLTILDRGLETWSSAISRIVDVIRTEIKRRIDIATSPLSRNSMTTGQEAKQYRDEGKAVRTSSRPSKERVIEVVFPKLYDADEVETPVPQSPLLQDIDDFEYTYSFSDDSEDDSEEDMELAIF